MEPLKAVDIRYDDRATFYKETSVKINGVEFLSARPIVAMISPRL